MTNDLISRADLMQFPIRIDSYDKKNGNEHFVLGIESVLEFAKYLPTVDAVEVVRCCECLKRNTPMCHAGHEQADMDYCSHGTRATGESEVSE